MVRTFVICEQSKFIRTMIIIKFLIFKRLEKNANYKNIIAYEICITIILATNLEQAR